MAESSRSNDVEMTDEEQARRIAAQAQPEGYAHISVPGWEYLSEGECIVTQDPQDERRSRFNRPRARNGTTFRPLHLDVADENGQQALRDTGDDVSRYQHIYSVPETSPSVPDSPGAARLRESWYRDCELRAYRQLAKQGVTPIYPLDQILRVAHSPEKFEPQLRPFYQHPPMRYGVEGRGFFQRQCMRWMQFRRWQANNRGIATKGLDLPAFREIRRKAGKRIREADFTPEALAGNLEWLRFQEDCDDERQWLRESQCTKFVDYEIVVKRRLDQAQAVGHSFSLALDFSRQTCFATWAEYVAFELWWLSEFRRDVAQEREKHQGHYAQLCEEAKLRPHETIEWLKREASSSTLQFELDKAVHVHAQAAVALQQASSPLQPVGGSGMRLTKSQRASLVIEAQQRLSRAEEKKTLAFNRRRLVSAFLVCESEYDEAVALVERQGVLVEWARERCAETEAYFFALPPQEREHRVSFRFPSEEPAADIEDAPKGPKGKEVCRPEQQQTQQTAAAQAAAPQTRPRFVADPSTSAAAAAAAQPAASQISPRHVAEPSTSAGAAAPAAFASIPAPALDSTPAAETAPRRRRRKAHADPSQPPRRSARIAELEARKAARLAQAAAQQALDRVQEKVGEAPEPRTRGRKRKAGEEEEEEDDEEPAAPTKRPRRRAAKK